MQHILKCHDIIKSDMVKGDNCYLYDKNNKRYVDFESGIWCTVVGHANPRINERIIKQINKVVHLGYRFTSYMTEEAALHLLDTVSERKGKCVFLSSGSEAVEFSVNIAKLITRKNLMLTFAESYLGAYGCAGKKDGNWITIDFNKCLNCKETTCFEDCENLKEINWNDIGTFVFEPGSSSGKVKFPPEKLIHLIVKQIKNSGGLLIANEVTTGLGRTGKWYGFNHYDISPDIIALGKGLGNGYPVSAVVMKNEIAAELENTEFRYVQSHQNDPLGCAIASEVIQIITEEHLVNRSYKLGVVLMGYLDELKNRYSFVKEVRGRGLMVGVEFSKSNDNLDIVLLSNQMLERGFIIGVNPKANLIRFMPPLTIEEDEIAAMTENLNIVLQRTGK